MKLWGTRAFLDVQSVNQCSRLLVGVLPEVLELMGLEVKIERLLGLDEDEKLTELISLVSDKKKTGKPCKWWTWREPGGVYSVFILRIVDKRRCSNVTSVEAAHEKQTKTRQPSCRAGMKTC